MWLILGHPPHPPVPAHGRLALVVPGDRPPIALGAEWGLGFQSYQPLPQAQIR